MNGAETVSLRSLATSGGLVGGPFGSSLVGSDYTASGIPVIRGTNLGHGRFVGGDFVHVSAAKANGELARNQAARGDLVFTQRGTLGQVALVPNDGPEAYVVSQSQMRLRVDPNKADPSFVYYACSAEAFKRQIDDQAIATGVPHINLGILGRLRVPDRPLSEQRAIAEVLGALDDKIAANTRLATTAEALATAHASSVPLSVPVASIARVSRSMVDPSSLGDDLVTLYSLPGFDAGRQPERVLAATIKSGKFDVREPAVLVSKLNPRIPRIWEVPAIPPGATLASTEFVVLHPIECDPAVLWALLVDPRLGATLESMVAGTSGSHQRVKPDEVLSALVGDPAELAPTIRQAITEFSLRAHAARAENRTLAATRDALLPALMSGALRVRDAERLAEHLT